MRQHRLSLSVPCADSRLPICCYQLLDFDMAVRPWPSLRRPWLEMLHSFDSLWQIAHGRRGRQDATRQRCTENTYGVTVQHQQTNNITAGLGEFLQSQAALKMTPNLYSKLNTICMKFRISFAFCSVHHPVKNSNAPQYSSQFSCSANSSSFRDRILTYRIRTRRRNAPQVR